MPGPGRVCPSSYRYGARALNGPAQLRVDSLWVAGGLYGNPFALERLIESYEREPGTKALVFNGDFHWFDVDHEDFRRINETVLGFHVTRGNVETELARPAAGAGCGCGYPDSVGENVVAHSNRIIERLGATAQALPHELARLAALPMYLSAEVGNSRVAVVHGDAESLSGWAFSQETLSTAEGHAAARAAFTHAGAKIFASSHTCLPVLQGFPEHRVVINNGAAGMPNFRGELFGLATRIALSPGKDVVYSARSGELFVEAVALRYDAFAWERRFLAQWPAGSDAHASYYRRIVMGPGYTPGQARRIR